MWWQGHAEECRKAGDLDYIYGGFKNFEDFAAALITTHGDPFPDFRARQELHDLRQTTSVTNNASHFQRIITLIPGLDPPALKYEFHKGLKHGIKVQLLGKMQKTTNWLQLRNLAH